MATRKRPRRASSRKRSRPTKSAKGGSAAARTVDRRKQKPETLRLRSVQPSLTVNDVERSIRFYTDALGFIVGARYPSEGGALRGASLKAGMCEIGLTQDDWAKGRDRKKGEGLRIWCQTTQDIDSLAARIKASGGRLTEEPHDQPWGGRSLGVDDPDGFHLTIYRE